ncbi:MAG: aminoacyl-tRNA hydrolase [Pseudomonadota bacterium]
MKLIAGLGNPGQKYTRNRHNIGFLAVDEIARAQTFGPWREKFQGEVSEGRIGTEKTLLLKPTTFMNLSGQAVGEAMRFYKMEPSDVIVLHDELDLAPGKLKVKTGGGHAGHNGLRSLHQHIGEAYVRVRLGIGHPGDKRLVSHYVLGDFAKADQEWLTPLIEGVARAIPELIAGDSVKFLSQVALHRQSAMPTAPPAARPKPAEPEPEPEPQRSALQRLMDKFS